MIAINKKALLILSILLLVFSLSLTTTNYAYADRIFRMKVSAYSTFDDQNGLNSNGDPEHTATMTYPTVGRTIAVDPQVIPYGSDVWIEGLGWYIAEDTGGAIIDSRIDVCVDTFKEANNFGIRTLKVLVKTK